jgi:hypothetical protein
MDELTHIKVKKSTEKGNTFQWGDNVNVLRSDFFVLFLFMLCQWAMPPVLGMVWNLKTTLEGWLKYAFLQAAKVDSVSVGLGLITQISYKWLEALILWNTFIVTETEDQMFLFNESWSAFSSPQINEMELKRSKTLKPYYHTWYIFSWKFNFQLHKYVCTGFNIKWNYYFVW